MNITDIFSSGVSEVVDSVAKGLDDLFTSDEERLKLKNALQEIKLQASQKDKEISNKFEAQISNRNKFDQIHGNFLTKSVRPIFLYWLMFLDTIIFLGGMFQYNVDPAYIEFIKIMNVTAITFFFGSKGIEIYKHGKLI